MIASNTNNNIFYLKVAKSPCRLSLKANLTKKRSQLNRTQSKPDMSN